MIGLGSDKKDLKASGTDLGTESANVQESAAQVPHSKTLLCRVVLGQSVDEGVVNALSMQR